MQNYKFCSHISKEEVSDSLRKTKTEQAMRPDSNSVEMWMCLGEDGLEWLMNLFNVLFWTAKMACEWRISTIVPLYKNKGDVQDCNNYCRGIRLLSHTIKLWERMTEGKLKRNISILENQFASMLGKSTIEAIHLIRKVIELYRDRRKDLHMVFINLEKAYNRILSKVVWDSSEKKEITAAYIRAIKDMYRRVRTSVMTMGEDTEDFPIDIRLHQVSASNALLFIIIMNELTKEIQDKIP